MDVRKLKRAYDIFQAYAYTKHEMRRAEETVETLTTMADPGLDVMEKVEAVVMGTFDKSDAIDTLFLGYNIAPKINPKLRERIPWRIKFPPE